MHTSEALYRLSDLSQELGISTGTVEKAIYTATGKTFRQIREQMLLQTATALLSSRPTSSIKEISVDLGFKSPRAFARAIKRASGFSPELLRAGSARELARRAN